ncbi:hypothetical protein M433DRAFT_745 [Acidomyces richmondensis BFW]|nr:MAG: hypothetical protein FE78DRAFT_31518 [Acidomyces sp. 'richmondensis']KYG49868.1 hypothetical protein M433DRAFT_745 [Acidomyces richmondensis BFW]
MSMRRKSSKEVRVPTDLIVGVSSDGPGDGDGGGDDGGGAVAAVVVAVVVVVASMAIQITQRGRGRHAMFFRVTHSEIGSRPLQPADLAAALPARHPRGLR